MHQLFAEVHFSRDGERNRVTLRQQGPVNQLPVIAVIDDDKVMRALLTAYLHEHYRVESYADSHAALLALGKQPPRWCSPISRWRGLMALGCASS